MTGVLLFLLGFNLAAITIDLLWKRKIREKAESGHRLWLGGKLYSVKRLESFQWDVSKL